MLSNTPASIHSSRRSRTVVSDTLFEHSRSASSHEQPVTSRTSMTSKQSRSEARWRWQPNGWVSTRTGSSGSTAAQMVSFTFGSSARMMGEDLHSVDVWSQHPDHLGDTASTSGCPISRANSQVIRTAFPYPRGLLPSCLLYTSDAADDLLCVD